VQGTARLLGLPEFRDTSVLERILSVLEGNDRLARSLLAWADPRTVSIVIGQENPLPEMRPFSIVSRAFQSASRPESRGVLAVVGPRRMDYGRAIAAIDRVACQLTSCLNAV